MSDTIDLDPARVSQQWAATAEALAEALARWREVSADTDGPLAELYDDAQRNAAHWRHAATGLTRSEASRAVDAEFGRYRRPSFINYDPEDDEGEDD